MDTQKTELVVTDEENKMVNISKKDIKIMMNILDIMNKRGSFLISEFELIGSFNNKLKELIK